MTTRPVIAALGAGRMGRGIAIVFAYAGHPVSLIDLKHRSAEDAARLGSDAVGEVHATLSQLAAFGLFAGDIVETIASRVTFHAHKEAPDAIAGADILFEGVPETLEAKEQALTFASRHARKEAIIASTTSTMLSDTLQGFVTHPQRFLNAHWLNPAYLVPLVELSPGAETDPLTTDTLKALLEAIGKVPVVCKARPGYIVPRIQALAMNEAARIVEEGVASAEDVDKATVYGFGFRFAVLGMLEFIDWGGGDILYYASRYLRQAMDDDRYTSPAIIEENMEAGRTGLRDGQGFLDYDKLDIPSYQRGRQQAFVDMLRHIGMARPPVT
jgi:3-hydroxybutyryl-CoA dehydrogenase